MELAKTDLSTLPESERNILTFAGARLIFAAAEPHIFEAVTAVFSCAGTEFTARGKTVLAGGWKDLERRYRATLKGKPDPEDMEEENTLPELSEGQSFEHPTAKVTEHFTTPPKPNREATLLSVMEHAGNGDTDPDAECRGLGTPATRAAVIEKLVNTCCHGLGDNGVRVGGQADVRLGGIIGQFDQVALWHFVCVLLSDSR